MAFRGTHSLNFQEGDRTWASTMLQPSSSLLGPAMNSIIPEVDMRGKHATATKALLPAVARAQGPDFDRCVSLP